MSWKSKVVWSEGLFLQQQHFQQHDRYIEHLIEARAGPIAPYRWGRVQFRLHEAALKLGKIALTAGRGVLPDGTPFDFPAVDEPPLPLDMPSDAKEELVVLAAPLRRHGSVEADLAGEDRVGLTRWRVVEQDVPDNNSGSDRSALVQVGSLRLRLMPRRELTDAYASLGVVRVVERQHRQPASARCPLHRALPLGARQRHPGRLRARDPGPAASARRGAGRAPLAARARRRG